MRNHEHLSKRRETNYREERSCKYSWKLVLPLSSLYFGWPLFSTIGFPLKMDIKIMIKVNYEGYKLLAKQISYDTDLEVYRYSRLSNEINFLPLKKIILKWWDIDIGNTSCQIWQGTKRRSSSRWESLIKMIPRAPGDKNKILWCTF